MAVVTTGALLMACGGGGPSDTEFVAACLKEGQGGASQLLDKELNAAGEMLEKCATAK